MAADIAGSIALCVLFGILLISFLVWKVERDEEYKRRYAALCKGDKFFLLDTYNGNKCIIEVKYVNPVGEKYMLVEKIWQIFVRAVQLFSEKSLLLVMQTTL